MNLTKSRIAYFAIFIALVMAVSFFYFQYHQEKKQYECHANIRHSFDTPNGYITSNLNISIIPKDGYVTVRGKIIVNGAPYNVNRDLFMKIGKK